MNTWAFTFVVIATLVLTNLVAFIRRGTEREKFLTYFADPDYHGSLAILLSLIGTIVGGGMFLAVGQIGFEAGITGVVIGTAYVVGFALFGLFAPTFRRVLAENQCQTLVDLLEKQYSKRVAFEFSAVSAGMYFFLLAGQFVALYDFATYSESLASRTWVPWTLVGLGAISMVIYPTIGGLRKDIATDVFQVVLILVGAGVLVWFFLRDPISVQMWSRLPPEHLSGTGSPQKGYGVLFLVGVLVFLPGLFLVRNDLWQRVQAAKAVNRLRVVFVVAGFVSCLFYVLFTLIGMWSLAAGHTEAKTATLYMIVSWRSQI